MQWEEVEEVDKYLRIKNQTQNSADLYIYGVIISGDWKWEDSDVTSTEIRDFLKTIDDVTNLNIYINSDGGSVFSGMAIYNMLKRHKAHKTVYIDGIAASIASVIAMVGDKIVIPSNAYLMIHKAWNYTRGNSNDMREMANILDKIDEGILNVYEGKIKDEVTLDKIKELVNNETWLTGKEAANYFKIEVGVENNTAACISDNFKNYKRVPKQLEKVEVIKNKNDDIELLQMELEIESSSFLL
jgi:ATP-dependent protease ClpP protease subunit